MDPSIDIAVAQDPKESAVGAVVRRIRLLIDHNGLRAGDALPTERELGERFGVGRNTVREAVGRLRAYGVVEVRPKVGAVIVNRHLEAALDLFSFQLEISEATFRDVQGFRRLIEVGSYDAIAAAASAEDLARLLEVNDAMMAATDGRESARHDFAFHLGLMRLAGNVTVCDIYRIMEPLIVRLMETGKESRGRAEAFGEHARIVAALGAKNRLAYRYLMSDHLDTGLAFVAAAGGNPHSPAESQTQGEKT